MSYLHKSDDGSALIATLVIMMVLVVLGGALAQYVLLDSRQTVREERDMQAYYLARSGADAAAEWIVQNPDLVHEIIGKTSEPVKLGEGHFVVNVAETGGSIRIDSTGNMGKYEQTVVLVLDPKESELAFDMAVFAALEEGSSKEPAIELEGSSRIIGTTGTNATGRDAVVLAWSTGIDGGDLLLGPGADTERVIKTRREPRDHVSNGEIRELSEMISYPAPQFPDFPDDLPYKGDFSTPWRRDLYYPIAEDGRYDSMEVTSNRTMTIDLQRGVRKIRARRMDILGKIELINVGANGKLLLYIDEEFKATNGSEINWAGEGADRPGVFNLYLNGTNPFGGPPAGKPYQFKFVGNVVTRSAPIVIGAGSEVIGNIVTGTTDVRMLGNVNATRGVIYAPNAHVSVENSGSTGAIVARTLSASGNARITYDASLSIDDFPTDVFETGDEHLVLRRGYTRSSWHPGT